MKRRILCMLLALVLCAVLLPVTAGAANGKELDLSQGYIVISPNGYTVGSSEKKLYEGEYVITQTSRPTSSHIVIGDDDVPGTYHVTLRDLNIDTRAGNNPGISIKKNSTVYLTIEGEGISILNTRVCAAIYMDSGSKLYISGNRALSLNSEDHSAISGQGSSEIHISGENTAVQAYAVEGSQNEKAYAIADYTWPVAERNLKVYVTDGASLSAYGGINCSTLTLDDTVSLWSQAWYDRNPALAYRNIEYRSDRGIYLYYYVRPQISIAALNSTAADASGTATKALSEQNSTLCYWTLQNGVLSSEGAVLRRGVESLAVSDTEYEGSLGSWALLNGRERTITPPVTPKEPEGTLLQTVIGSGIFFVPEDFPFYDVDSNDWFYEPVRSAWEADLIDGVTARYYMPENTLTVAQAVKLAAALHQKQSVGFVTLQNGGMHWYDNYVNYAVTNGLIEAAYQSKSAEVMNAPVTRAEFVHILSKLLRTGAVNTVNSIPDVKEGDAYADEIFAFYRAGILTGSDRLGTFHPESSLKRSEAAAILVRLYDASQRQYITLR